MTEPRQSVGDAGILPEHELGSMPSSEDLGIVPAVDTPRGSQPARLGYLDGLRGFCAMQVLFSHLLLAFFPLFVEANAGSGSVGGYVHASPLFFLYDGGSAVYVFFVLSGYVLTGSFTAARATLTATLGSRLLRLSIPAVAACAFSAVLFQGLGGVNDAAAKLSHSRFLAYFWHPGNLWFLKDGLINGVLLGYRDFGVLEWFGYSRSALDPLKSSYVAPLWSLSVEFYGSILVLLLVRYASARTRASRIVLLFTALVFCRTAFFCFLIGHLAARHRLGERPPVLPLPGSAAAIVIAGMATCVASQFWHPQFLDLFCAVSSRLLPPCFFDAPDFAMRMYGSILFTIGLMQCHPLRVFFAQRFMQAMGRLSFSIYLVHWPIALGAASYLLVKLEPYVGSSGARIAATAGGFGSAILAALAFIHVDTCALRLSRVWSRNEGRPSPF